jgi:hypothetical protein
LCPHIEWAVSGVLGQHVRLDWQAQPAAPGLVRADFDWQCGQGTGARLASALRGWEHLRYEVTEDASRGYDGARWLHTPDLGIFHAVTDVVGNIVVPEDRVRAALEYAREPQVMVDLLDLAIGAAWDEELEPFRACEPAQPQRRLYAVS